MDWIVCTAVGACLRNVLRSAARSEQARKQAQILKHESKEVENEAKKKPLLKRLRLAKKKPADEHRVKFKARETYPPKLQLPALFTPEHHLPPFLEKGESLSII